MIFSCSEAGTGRVLLKKRTLKNFAKFAGKHLRRNLFFNKAQSLQLYLNRDSKIYFSVNFAKLLRTPILQNISEGLLLPVVKIMF